MMHPARIVRIDNCFRASASSAYVLLIDIMLKTCLRHGLCCDMRQTQCLILHSIGSSRYTTSC